MALPELEPGVLPPGAERLRAEVRAFLAAAEFEPRCDAWLTGADPGFSRELGARGWLGMTLPAEYGGRARTALERFVVVEELLAAGAPVGAHWIADRQMGPSLLANGTDGQKREFLPAIARGECFFAIGMSEPGAGSDLASVRTRAEHADGGWRLTGTKVWTSGAHLAHAIVVLARSAPGGPRHEGRHEGLSQFVVRLPGDGVTIRPILGLSGEHHFNEVVFDGAPAELLGREGDGWRQVTAELAHERSGPERFLSTFALVRLVCSLAPGVASGRLVGRLWALRQASLAVAGALAAGRSPDLEAAVVKDLGTRFEREVIDVAREQLAVEPDPASPDLAARLLAQAVVQAPGFTLRGGTNEILRGIVARGLGVR
ncbi:acyl-CoA dehydrogenase family protein [Actinomadura harenae]|uniref:Acyl-CoA dehydrogenase n=1 Tax=Actinomadura harenae TaxID=2483351 RepID=A0A3M2LXT4_9ACTN|nr:acyl-CoA dehydrogenase family protein [Actinomadura harenae]RMI41393.1 acyl-CoA dehydrogenase [Actinomadura harenae]